MSALQLSAALLVNPLPALLLAALFILVMLRLSFRQREKASVRRHRRYQAAAARVLEKLGTLPGMASVCGTCAKLTLMYLRNCCCWRWNDRG